MSKDPYAIHTRWQRLTPLGWWVIGLLAVSGSWSLAGLVEMATAPAATDITTTPSEFGQRIQDVLGAGPASQQAFASVFGVALAITWLVWQHRAQANLYARRVPGLRYTPGWSVGWWFIPLANVVVPYLSMRELLRHAGAPAGSRSDGGGGQLGAWWLTYLGSAVLGLAGALPICGALLRSIRIEATDPGSLSPITVTAEAIRTARTWAMAGRVSALVAAGLAIWLVWTISRAEDAVFEPTHGASASMAVPPRPDLW